MIVKGIPMSGEVVGSITEKPSHVVVSVKPNNLTFKDKPIIVNRTKGTIHVWNAQQNEYVDMSFELVEDLARFIKSKKKFDGIVYK